MGTPVGAIAEFNIIKGSFLAEYGMVRTGLVSFSLKSGTNQFHGSVFENFRNRAQGAGVLRAGKAALPAIPRYGTTERPAMTGRTPSSSISIT
jgi:hypothetical protein